MSYVEIDTFKSFGDTCQPLAVNVWARVWSDGNYRMLIKPKWNYKQGKDASNTKAIWGIGSDLLVFRDELCGQIALARIGKRYGTSLNALTDGRHWGAGAGIMIRF